MHLSADASAATDPAAVWRRVTDVDRWASWSPGVLRSETDGPFEVGMRARIVYRGLRAIVWTVDRIDGRSFRWRTDGTGFVMVETYAVTAELESTTVHIRTAVSGWMGWAVALILRRPWRHRLPWQAAGAVRGVPDADARREGNKLE